MFKKLLTFINKGFNSYEFERWVKEWWGFTKVMFWVLLVIGILTVIGVLAEKQKDSRDILSRADVKECLQDHKVYYCRALMGKRFLTDR